ncbi:MAG: hypothetical protein LQ342_001524 [Letrouitia transgressa]|nr:MAG: hypothetical protein LQ342_001524 [Letrouitia transgressa]
MADQSHSDTEDVEKWLGVFPTKQPEVVKQSSPTKQPEVIRQSSPTKQPQVVRQASPENQPQVIRQASPERQPSPTRQASSEKQSPPLRQASPGKQPPLARHYSGVSGVPWDAHNYFRQRYSLFFKYDDGICMTDEAWFGVTPEPVACTVAQHMADAAPSAKSIIIDCFAGVGGNTIAFASSNRWTQIFAIEKDRDTIACAKKNAKIYGVSKKITWIEGDCFEVLDGELSQLCPRAVIFASPPWGGKPIQHDHLQ